MAFAKRWMRVRWPLSGRSKSSTKDSVHALDESCQSSSAYAAWRERKRFDVPKLKLSYVLVNVRLSRLFMDTKNFELESPEDVTTESHIRSLLETKDASGRDEVTRDSQTQCTRANNYQGDSESESDHVKQLRTILQMDPEPRFEIRLATWKSRECVEVFQESSSDEAGRVIVRYIRWTFEGHDSISRSLASFLHRQPDAFRELTKAGMSYQEKLQILLDSHGLDWRVSGHVRTAERMACVEISAPGIPRGQRVRIARFVTGWYSTPESIARGLFEDWARRPEGILILKNGRREWEEETRCILGCQSGKEVTS